MNPITLEWLAKAEGDFATAERESKVTTSVNYDAVCFHAQQCVEKYPKAVLQENAVVFSKTHDLAALLNLALSLEPSWVSLETDMNALTIFSVAYRYPGEAADNTEAQDAMSKCRDFRGLARQKLGLPKS